MVAYGWCLLTRYGRLERVDRIYMPFQAAKKLEDLTGLKCLPLKVDVRKVHVVSISLPSFALLEKNSWKMYPTFEYKLLGNMPTSRSPLAKSLLFGIVT